MGSEALCRRRGARRHRRRLPRRSSTGSKARPSRCSPGGGTPARSAQTAAGRAAQLMQILREWRGGLHLVATTAVGLSPLEAILTNEGPGQAKFFGWSEPFPDCAEHQGQARRGRGDDQPAVRGRRWPRPSSVQARGLRGRRPDPPRRHAVGLGPGRTRAGAEAGTGYSEGLLNGRKLPTGGHTAIAATDLWCSSECTPPCQGGGRGFKSRQVRHQIPTRPCGRSWLPGRVAQLVERVPEKREVTGSTPVPTTSKDLPIGKLRRERVHTPVIAHDPEPWPKGARGFRRPAGAKATTRAIHRIPRRRS